MALRHGRNNAARKLLAQRRRQQCARARLDAAALRTARSPAALAGAAVAGFLLARSRPVRGPWKSGPRRLLAKLVVLHKGVRAVQAWLG